MQKLPISQASKLNKIFIQLKYCTGALVIQYFVGEIYLCWYTAESKMLGTIETETGDPARLPAQVASRWRLIKWKSMRWGKYILYWADQTRQGRAKIYCNRGRVQWTNHYPRKGQFHMYSRVPNCLSFNSQQGPPLSEVANSCKINVLFPTLIKK
jgi:hypothetical protein